MDSSTDRIDKESLLRTPAPFIVQIVNSNELQSISNVDIGDSYTNRTAQNFGQNSNITITSGILGVNYRSLLSQSESQPFTVIATMIISTSSGQLDQPVGITHRNASGDAVTRTMTPTLFINQRQSDRVADGYSYSFDGFTRMRFNQINAGATVTVRIYTKEVYNALRLLENKNPIEKYGNPRIW